MRGAMQRIASLVFVLSSAFMAFTSSSAQAGPLGTPVVGGKTVQPGAWPDVVAVFGADGSMCTGTLIDVDLVLTAGHCIEIDPIEVRIGSVDLAKPDGDRRRVKWARAYPEWIDTYDIGVIMLENPVATKPRAIAQGCTTRERFSAGLPLQLVGFGLTTKAGVGDNTKLHQATLPLVDPTCTTDPSCMPAVAPYGEFTAGGSGADSCFGDSGGPVYIETAGGPALVGVVSRGLVSWDEPCGGGGVYVRADKVVSWIQRVSDRKLHRVACDAPADAAGEAAVEPAGCSAAGSAAGGGLAGGLALYYAVLVVAGLRRARRRDQPASR